MAVLAMCVSDQTLDISKYSARQFFFAAITVPVDEALRCVMMAVVHDLAEAQGAPPPPIVTLHSHLLPAPVGDIAPQEGIPKAEKQRRESVRPFSTARLCSR